MNKYFFSISFKFLLEFPLHFFKISFSKKILGFYVENSWVSYGILLQKYIENS